MHTHSPPVRGIAIVRGSSPGLIQYNKIPGHLSGDARSCLNHSRTVSWNCSTGDWDDKSPEGSPCHHWSVGLPHWFFRFYPKWLLLLVTLTWVSSHSSLGCTARLARPLEQSFLIRVRVIVMTPLLYHSFPLPHKAQLSSYFNSWPTAEKMPWSLSLSGTRDRDGNG